LSVTSYAIDTRKLSAGGAFFALAGHKVDGHAFVADAARAGALLAVVARPPTGGGPFPSAMIQVDDVAAALARCGAFARQRIRGKVVAITGAPARRRPRSSWRRGSRPTRRSTRTIGNLNNELGVPLSLLSCPDDAEAAVFEMGMNGPGQIAFLARLVTPTSAS
jgi:UDP-N-acetylmuramoyl-tripeptide--D-alanyl-D-alanine ligase